eukprot:CAMPEP_0115247860 /NCGR_PEP_ID=MMETSP0270-20121206/41771_1 /TAXON_ID=71861 /ORGANISM="Scrippsiella trochoidea, Strain CCMP3099" /LENGTH=174 /DNA_ID=CAMNT_0002663141 /DNA_START=593 /DNA_END=1117 /DNA_ORIENTATION=-
MNLSMMLTALPRPSSARKVCPKALAFSITASSVVQRFKAAAKPRTSTLENCRVATPTPLSATNCALWNWSKAQGVITEGTPLRRAAAVVPAPPWWTIAWHCGNSHSCGADLMKSTLSLAYSFIFSESLCPSSIEGFKFAQPPKMIPRSPVLIKARTARQAICTSETAIMEPHPM